MTAGDAAEQWHAADSLLAALRNAPEPDRWAAEMKSYSQDMRADLLDEYEQKTEESLLLLWHKGHVA